MDYKSYNLEREKEGGGRERERERERDYHIKAYVFRIIRSIVSLKEAVNALIKRRKHMLKCRLRPRNL